MSRCFPNWPVSAILTKDMMCQITEVELALVLSFRMSSRYFLTFKCHFLL